jgi:uncharacterized protein with PIN domain
MSRPKEAVLDACAVIAYLNDEEGAQKIDDLVAESRPLRMAAINVLEVA